MSPAQWRKSLRVFSDLLFCDLHSVLVRIMLAAVTNEFQKLSVLTQWEYIYWLQSGPIWLFLVSGSNDVALYCV